MKEMLSRLEIEQATRLLERKIKKADKRPISDFEMHTPFMLHVNLQIGATYEGRLEALKWVLGETNDMTKQIGELLSETSNESPIKRRRGRVSNSGSIV